jgi:serine/threonine protein kinase
MLSHQGEVMFELMTHPVFTDCNDVLGKGTYGTVCKALDKKGLVAFKAKRAGSNNSPTAPTSSSASPSSSSSTICAVKRVTGIFHHAGEVKRLVREVSVMRQLSHPNIVRLVAVMGVPGLSGGSAFTELYLVLEHCETDLGKIIDTPGHLLTPSPAVFLRLEQIQHIMYQVLLAVNYLHSASVLHRDIKPANILINTASCHVKLCDFGLARFVPGGVDGDARGSALDLTSLFARSLSDGNCVVTRYYRAPELLCERPQYGGHVDSWSVGCVLAELLNCLESNFPNPADRARRPLFRGRDDFDQLLKVVAVLGTPSQEDILSVATTPKFSGPLMRERIHPGRDLLTLYPGLSNGGKLEAEVLQLLAQLLTFNPARRLSVREALRLQFVANSPNRLPENEYCHTDPFDAAFESVSATNLEDGCRHLTKVVATDRLLASDCIEWARDCARPAGLACILIAAAVFHTEVEPSKGLSPQLWVPDEARDACHVCASTFSVFFRWKHHCRRCGEVVCEACAAPNIVPPGHTQPQRVCVQCLRDTKAAVRAAKRLWLKHWHLKLSTSPTTPVTTAPSPSPNTAQL